MSKVIVGISGNEKELSDGSNIQYVAVARDLSEGVKVAGGLPIHVRFLLDEFANIGLIPKFEKLIATIRSREISASIILQAQSQLKAIYKDHADTIVGMIVPCF